ncbi:LysR family transcriptional regulator [Arthrobacter ramosus]|uniref:LysR family transcriptional regulator n=1 Tax=Arthrobacter ramosus TaxID=1672 RepID=A0ABV5XZY7_ARTRM|nr:LysR family transcriptional regulator [Arthrobacter ramosus]
MELRRLGHFVAVAEEGSFTRAARRVHLVQSALSVSVRGLEKELGVRLFERSTHDVQLTDVGRVFLPEARATLAAAAAALDAVQATVGGLRGTLRIGIMQSMLAVDLASILARFRDERPGVELRLRPARGGSLKLSREVESGELDVAFVSVAGHAFAGVELTSLAREPLLLAVPVGHPLAGQAAVTIPELDRQIFVEAPVGWGTRFVADRAFADAHVNRSISVEVADLATVVELVRAGLGLGLIPQSVARLSDRVEFVPLDPPLEWEIALAVSTKRRASAAGQAFEDLVLDMTGSGGL